MSKIIELFEQSLCEEREAETDEFDLAIEEYSELEQAKLENERERVLCKYEGISCSYGICDECDITGKELIK